MDHISLGEKITVEGFSRGRGNHALPHTDEAMIGVGNRNTTRCKVTQSPHWFPALLNVTRLSRGGQWSKPVEERFLLRCEFVVGDQPVVSNLLEPLQLPFERRVRVSGRRRSLIVTTVYRGGARGELWQGRLLWLRVCLVERNKRSQTNQMNKTEVQAMELLDGLEQETRPARLTVKAIADIFFSWPVLKKRMGPEPTC